VPGGAQDQYGGYTAPVWNQVGSAAVPAQNALNGYRAPSIPAPAFRTGSNDEIIGVLARLVELLGGRESTIAFQSLGSAGFEVTVRIQVCYPPAMLGRMASDDPSQPLRD
jgi:hypothetical protein